MSTTEQASETVAEYHRDYSRVSKTMLNHFATSSDDYYRYYVAQTDTPPGPTGAMNVGTAVHAILLEAKLIGDVCVTYPDDCFKSNGHLNPKPAAAFRDFHADKMVLKADELAAVENTVAAIEQHELGELISHPEAKFEQVIRWRDKTVLQCRAMIDFFLDLGDKVVAYDLKTTDQIYPRQFARVAKRLRYWLQDAHYSDGLRHTFHKPVEFKFWCVETKPPHRIAQREYDKPSRENAVQFHRRYMDDLAVCYETGEWRDEWTRKTTTLTLGPWDEDFADPEVPYDPEE